MDWTNPAGAAVQGIFGLAGSALNYKFQKELIKQQNQYNLDMWNLQNEYNSPQAQMRRFEEAGLNPALMYSQGNAGNASNAPIMTTPEAPDFSRDLREIAQAFNIEGLRTAIANRQKAQAEADIAKTEADRNKDKYEAEIMWGENYQLDPRTGQFVLAPRSGALKEPGRASSWYYLNNLLADNFRTNSLLVPRANLIGSQRSLNLKRQALLAPQIRYWNFNTTPWRMNTRFWIGNAKDGAQIISNFIP